MSNTPSQPSWSHAPEMELPEDSSFEYSNLVRIAHSPSELIFDFAQILPPSRSAHITSRIIMSPVGAKLFLRALNDNLARYEATFGEIHLPGEPTLADSLFNPIKPDE